MMNEMMNEVLNEMPDVRIHCEICGDDFEPIIKMQADGEIETGYLKCPHCGTIYIICVTDAELRKKMMEYRKLYLRNCKKRLPERKLRQMQKMLDANVKRCNELIEQHPFVRAEDTEDGMQSD